MDPDPPSLWRCDGSKQGFQYGRRQSASYFGSAFLAYRVRLAHDTGALIYALTPAHLLVGPLD